MIVGVVIVGLLVLAAAVMGVTVTVGSLRAHKVINADRYRVKTRVGWVTVTKVWNSNRGFEYEIHTDFKARKGIDDTRQTRYFYVAPSVQVVDRKIAALVEDHEAGNVT